MAPPAVRIPPREAQIGPDPAGETQRRITGEGALRDAAAEYVAGGNAPTVAEEMALYADTVDYYGQGAKNRVEIRADLAGERKKWPSRRFQISRIIRTDYDPVLDRGSIVFRYQYELANGAKRRSGEAESTIVFRSVSKGPEVVLVKEHTVP